MGERETWPGDPGVALVEHVNDAVYLLKNGRFLFVNQKFSDLFNIDRLQVCNPSFNPLMLVAPESHDLVRDRFMQIENRAAENACYQFRARTSDGRTLHVEASVSHVPYADGLATYGVLRDISDRKALEDSLRQSEERYRQILDDIQEGYLELSLDGKVVFCNHSLEELLGCGNGELVGCHYRSFVPPHEEKKILPVFLRVLERGEPARLIFFDVIPNQGETKTISMSVSPIRDGSGCVTGFRSIVREVTDQVRMARALQKSKARYKNLYDTLGRMCDHLPDLFWAKDLKKRYLFTNRAMREVVLNAVTLEEARGKTDLFFAERERKAHPENPDWHTFGEICFDSDEAVLQSGKPGKFVECGNVKGRRLCLEVFKAPLFDNAGQVIGTVGCGRDVTHEQQLEEQLRHAQRMEAVGTLASGIAHDFNNLLMGIQGYVSLMLLTLNSDHAFHDRLMSIQEQIHNGAALTRQLLGFAHGGHYADKRATDLNKFLDRAIETFGRTRKEVAVTKRFDPALLRVDIDRVQMDQVFLNLFINAWQAMPIGGDLLLYTANVWVNGEAAERHSVEPGQYICVSVTDTGIGMDEATMARIFDPFFTTKAVGRGTGLGLASAYGIVHKHGGFIEVCSEKGMGSTFRVYLPATELPAEETARAPEEVLQRGTETVLVVDDERINIEVLNEFLEILGYRVLTAGSGQEAIAVYMARRSQIDLVILDMIMPGVGGGKAFDTLRGINPGVKVLLTSGLSMEGLARDIMERGCNGFLQKPFLLHSLSAKVRQVLDG